MIEQILPVTRPINPPWRPKNGNPGTVPGWLSGNGLPPSYKGIPFVPPWLSRPIPSPGDDLIIIDDPMILPEPSIN